MDGTDGLGIEGTYTFTKGLGRGGLDSRLLFIFGGGFDRWHSVPGVAATLHFSRRSVLAHLIIYKGVFGCGVRLWVVTSVAVRRKAQNAVGERSLCTESRRVKRPH